MSGLVASQRPDEKDAIVSLLDRQAWVSLIHPIAESGGDAMEVIGRLRRYSEMLIRWNRNVSNLISKNDEGRLVSRHLLESIEPAHWMKGINAKTWIDLGSGAGLPAIPLSLLGIGESWSLVESRRPKILFIRRVVQELGLVGIRAVHSRLESLVDDSSQRQAYDAFTSRATIPLGPTLALASEFVKPGGVAFLWKGSRREEEMDRDKRWRDMWELDGLLGLGGGQVVVAKFNKKS
jgi:16S rRNA (guanine(527)-N(7))-methyltransferase RsmG